MVFAVDVCLLPVTGGSTFVVAAGLFMLIAGVIVTRWVRASAGRMSVVVAPLVLLGGLVLAPSATDPCSPATTIAPTVTTVAATTTTTVAPTTTVVPVDPNLVLEIDTTVLAPTGIDSVTVADESFVFELGLLGEVDVHIDWGDGSTDNVSDAGPFPHTYTTSGSYIITVSGLLTGFGQEPLNYDFGQPLNGARYLKAVRSFGELGITSLTLAFWGSTNLIDVPATLPTTVTNTYGMFAEASSFDGDVSSWDTGSVTNMSIMFGGASLFNGDVSGWDTGSATNMQWMFVAASSFNGDVSGWDTGSVTNMIAMFERATAFNQSLSGWETGSVTNMSGMFAGASTFNQSLNNWDTGSVTNMIFMFGGASSFDGDVSGWETGSVTNMNYMFYGASSFNQSLGAWDIKAVVDMTNMLDGSALSVDNYDATLNGWADTEQVKQLNVTLGADGLYFSIVGQSAHDVLTNPCGDNPSNWQIVDSGLEPTVINNDQRFAVACS